jgi:hypothetical protein
MTTNSRLTLLCFTSCFLLLSPAFSQAKTYLPDAPSALLSAPETSSSLSGDDGQEPSGAPQNAPATHEDPQQKRIFGIIPNFKSVTAGTKLPPQTAKDKFITASQDSFDYSSLTLAATVSLYDYAKDATPEFHTGGAAYGRYFWHSYLDEISENYFVEFFLPTALHEDTRYYSLGHGGFAKRATYSLSRAFITRTDSGRKTFNASEIFGAGAAAGVSNLYYPRPERTLSNTVDQWGTSIGIDVASFFFREFYPDIYHAMFHAKVDASAPSGK